MLYITGITGHSGKWLLKRLAEEQYEGRIRCVIRESRSDAPKKYKIFEGCNLDLEFAIGDLEDADFLRESLKGIDTIINIAGIGISERLVDAALENHVSWAILIHTTGRFSKFKSASEGYIQTEDAILKRCNSGANGGHALNCTILRPTMIYGSSMDKNMYRLVDYLHRHKFFPLFGNGSNLMQPVHARDLGNAYYGILMHPEATRNKSYNLSGKEPITYLDIIKTVKKQLNSKVLIIKIPISLSIFAARVYNMLFRNAIISVEQVMRMQEDKAYGHEDASRDFDYDPMSFEEGIREEVEEYLGGVRVDFSNVTYK
jgi:nucleoside-diphosphate-sugar epimerase